MQYADLTKTSKSRLNFKVTKCPICEELFTEVDDIQVVKYRCGKYMEYHFIHTNCLRKGAKDGKVV